MEEKKVEVKLKEYDEVFCSKKSCHEKLKVEKTLTMVSGFKGYLTCPVCGHRTHVYKTRPNDEDYNVDKEGTRTRKTPKIKMTKKERRRFNKRMRDEGKD